MNENEIKVLRMNLLGGMHDYVMNVVQDEGLQKVWLTDGVPDEPTEEDLEFIAKADTLFAHTAYQFGHIVFADLDNK